MVEKPTILYIEDDALARKLVAKVLAKDFDVVTAANGLEGLNVVQQRRLDLILTDLNLPDLNGEYIATRVNSLLTIPVPIVAITAQPDRQLRLRALAAGCIGFIAKPIDIGTLPDLIRDYMSGNRVDKLTDAEHKRASQELAVDLAEKLEKSTRKVEEDNAELRLLERAKTAFLTQVSHELRTPLTVLSGYIQMLHKEIHSGSQITENMRDLSELSVDGLKRLHRLMNEIVVMARLSTNQLDAYKSPVKLGQIALDVAQEYGEAIAERRQSFQTTGSGWERAFTADPTLIRMMFSNLLSNAIKFTPDGGKLSMGIEGYPEAIHIWLQDTGVGISKDSLPLLFKPFYTNIDVSRGRTSKTEYMGMGMGVGLTIVGKIVEAHKGKIWAESPGYDEQTCPGSAFHILLPIRDVNV